MNSFIEIDDVEKRYGSNTVLNHISLSVEKGEMVSLLGPSGCGKSTLLRAVAGLTRLDGGRVCVDGRDITDVDVRKRQVGMVFQSYALFPNMTAAQNVAFGLHIGKRPQAEIDRRVKEMLSLVGLEDKAHLRPSQLSGGQQQRVALSRALVMEPKVLLLDEPLSALDAQIRQNLRAQIREIQQAMKITAIFVTHDQEEAMSVSDRVFIMHGGVIAQSGAPETIYRNPENEFVARFIGHYNVLQPLEAARLFHIEPPACKVAAIRPEAFATRPGEDCLSVTGRMTQLSILGSIIRYKLVVGELSLLVETVNRHDALPGLHETVTLYLDRKDLLPIMG